MGEQMALEVVLSCKLCGAVGAAMLLCGRRARAPSIIARIWQAKPATRIAQAWATSVYRRAVRRQHPWTATGHRIRKGFIAVLVKIRDRPRTRSIAIL